MSRGGWRRTTRNFGPSQFKRLTLYSIAYDLRDLLMFAPAAPAQQLNELHSLNRPETVAGRSHLDLLDAARARQDRPTTRHASKPPATAIPITLIQVMIRTPASSVARSMQTVSSQRRATR